MGIGVSWGRNTGNRVPQVMPCCQPRKTCLIADFCPVWAWKRAGSPVIPEQDLCDLGAGARAGSQRQQHDRDDQEPLHRP